MIATQATMASHPIERMIHVQTAACAVVRMLIPGGFAESYGTRWPYHLTETSGKDLRAWFLL
jgi:hypothetical protein